MLPARECFIFLLFGLMEANNDKPYQAVMKRTKPKAAAEPYTID